MTARVQASSAIFVLFNRLRPSQRAVIADRILPGQIVVKRLSVFQVAARGLPAPWSMRRPRPFATFSGSVAVPLHGLAPLPIQIGRVGRICSDHYEVTAAMMRAVLVHPMPAMPRLSKCCPCALHKSDYDPTSPTRPRSFASALLHGLTGCSTASFRL